MPNHVHVIVTPTGDWTLSKITHSWKSFTANEINKLTNHKGPVWMPESFDHIIRSPEQLEKIRQYIVTQASSLSGQPYRYGRDRQDACDPQEDASEKHRQDACDPQDACDAGALVTYFRRGKLQKFFLADSNKTVKELDFMTAARLLESSPEEKKQKLPEAFYDLLDKNKEAFILATIEEMAEPPKRRGRDSAANILRILKATMKNTQKLTDDQELYLRKVLIQLEEGGLPKQTTKSTLQALNELKGELVNPFKVLATLQTHIPERLLQGHYAEQSPATTGKREVILSLYLVGK